MLGVLLYLKKEDPERAGACMTCFLSIAPSALGKFQRSSNSYATFSQSCSDFG